MRFYSTGYLRSEESLCRSHRHRRGQPGWTWRSDLISNQGETVLITFNTLSLTNAPKLKKIDKFFFKNEKFFKKISQICSKTCFRLEFRRFDD